MEQQLQQSQQHLRTSQQECMQLQDKHVAASEQVNSMRQELQGLQGRLGARDASVQQQLQVGRVMPW